MPAAGSLVGAGEDTFIYSGSGNDVVKNAGAGDAVNIDESITLDDIANGGGQIVGNNVIVQLNNGNTLTVEGGAKNDVTFNVAGQSYVVNDGEWDYAN